MSGVDIMLPPSNIMLSNGNEWKAETSAVKLNGEDEISAGEREHDVNRNHVAVASQGSSPATSPHRAKKTRRAKKKRKYKPYYKLSWSERKDLEDREAKRANRVREERFAHGQPVAPYNTTQFLMNEHDELNDQDLVPSVPVDQYGQPQPQSIMRQPRVRDYSFSLESDDDFFYSSPEDEEFLSREFFHTYADVHAERLTTMSKDELVQEYIQLEEKVEILELKLLDAVTKDKQKGSSDEEMAEGEMRMEPEMAEKIRIYQQEIGKLQEENRKLLSENDRLRKVRRVRNDSDIRHTDDSESDSVSSSSTSSDSSTSSESSEDSGDEADNVRDVTSTSSSTAAATLTEEKGESPKSPASARDS